MIMDINKKFKKSERGIVLYLTILILASMMAISISIATLFIGEFKISGDIQKSMNAVYASDSGLEAALFYARQNPASVDLPDTLCSLAPLLLVLPPNASCVVNITGIGSGVDVVVKSTGTFPVGGFNRKIQAKYQDL